WYLSYMADTDIYPPSLHDSLPISVPRRNAAFQLRMGGRAVDERRAGRSLHLLADQRPGLGHYRPELRRTADRHAEAKRPLPLRRSVEHTSELQSRENLVCRLLLEK